MSGARILLVDDDVAILRSVRRSLQAHGYAVETADTVASSLSAVDRFRPELILLDLVLPDGDGIEVCRSVRTTSSLPIIVLSAIGDDRKKVDALDEGADDYLTKPFSMPELLARIRVALRRSAGLARDPILRAGPVSLDITSRDVRVGDTPVHLTPKEFDLLKLLLREQGRVLTQHRLLGEVWGPEYTDDRHILRTFVHQLRTKLGAISGEAAALIVNDPGVGYRISQPES